MSNAKIEQAFSTQLRMSPRPAWIQEIISKLVKYMLGRHVFTYSELNLFNVANTPSGRNVMEFEDKSLRDTVQQMRDSK